MIFYFSEFDDPHSVIVLAEEEIVAIDLTSEGWPTFRQPYLASLHSSAITTATHVAKCTRRTMDKDRGCWRRSNGQPIVTRKFQDYSQRISRSLSWACSQLFDLCHGL